MRFQERVVNWLQACFKRTAATSVQERGDRFLEEALELLQATGYPRERIAQLVDYTYSRPPGEPKKEVGGVMVTLAAFCWALGVDLDEAAATEIARIETPEMMARARAKDASSPEDSPLPGTADMQYLGSGRWEHPNPDSRAGSVIGAMCYACRDGERGKPGPRHYLGCPEYVPPRPEDLVCACGGRLVPTIAANVYGCEHRDDRERHPLMEQVAPNVWAVPNAPTISLSPAGRVVCPLCGEPNGIKDGTDPPQCWVCHEDAKSLDDQAVCRPEGA